jgi:methyl-accepting chemotaxis protein
MVTARVSRRTTGTGTVDTPFVRRAQETANRIAETFEEALSRGEITLEDLFDESYVPIPGTNPQQMMTKIVPLADRLLMLSMTRP